MTKSSIVTCNKVHVFNIAGDSASSFSQNFLSVPITLPVGLYSYIFFYAYLNQNTWNISNILEWIDYAFFVLYELFQFFEVRLFLKN